MIEFVGYAPDQNTSASGVITNCDAIVPSLSGMKGAPTPVTTSIAALGAACRGVQSIILLDGTIYGYAGTATALYRDTNPTWTDISRLVGGAYAVPATGRWRFAQYGNITLAINKGDKMQYVSSGGANFALVTKAAVDAPKASIVEVIDQFVFVFDYDDGVDYRDGWKCSAYGDYTDWTTAVATQCTSGRLVHTNGRITAGKKFGSQIVVYKEASMYVGTYVGKPAVWAFELVPGEAGALSQEAVANVGTVENPRHIFMGRDDFYSFDGGRPIPIGQGILKRTVFAEINLNYAYAAQSVYDRKNSRLYFYYPSGSTDTCDKCVVYNTITKQWGRDNRQIEACYDYSLPGLSYNNLSNYYTEYDDVTGMTYDQLGVAAGNFQPAIIDTSHNQYTLTGSTAESFITTGDFGDEEKMMLLTRVRPRFTTAPTISDLTCYYKNNLGDSLTTGDVCAYSGGRYDLLRSARFHRLKFVFNGDVEIVGFTPYVQEDGLE